MSGDEMIGHVQARRDSIRARAKRVKEGNGGLSNIDVLLCEWGKWAIRCESGALGFASSCSLGGLGSGDAYDSAVPRGVIDHDMEAVDGAVRRLPGVQRLAVTAVYMHGAGQSLRAIAERIGIAHKSLTQYLNEAQRKIALDISVQCPQNPHQSVIGGNAPETIKPVLARA